MYKKQIFHDAARLDLGNGNLSGYITRIYKFFSLKLWYSFIVLQFLMLSHVQCLMLTRLVSILFLVLLCDLCFHSEVLKIFSLSLLFYNFMIMYLDEAHFFHLLTQEMDVLLLLGMF